MLTDRYDNARIYPYRNIGFGLSVANSNRNVQTSRSDDTYGKLLLLPLWNLQHLNWGTPLKYEKIWLELTLTQFRLNPEASLQGNAQAAHPAPITAEHTRRLSLCEQKPDAFKANLLTCNNYVKQLEELSGKM